MKTYKQIRNTRQRAFIATFLIICLLVIMLEILRSHWFSFVSQAYIPSVAAVAFLTIVLYTALSFGKRAGFLSSLGAIGYFLYLYSSPGNLFHYSDQALNRIFIISFVLLALAYITGYLRQRADVIFANEHRARAEAEKRTAMLRELETRKDSFVNVASHELKTPLTSVKVYTRILEKLLQKKEDKESLKYLVRLDKQVDVLKRLVNDLLDLSKIQAGKIDFQMESFNLTLVVQEVIETFQHITLTHTILFKGKAKRNMFGDKDRISQVISNFLSNAIRYSPEGSLILVTIASDTDFATVSVKDEGIGISKKHQSKIFKRFYQVKDSQRESKSGLGLGLFISHEIIKRHRGQIAMESEVGKGSTFYFTLPYVK